MKSSRAIVGRDLTVMNPPNPNEKLEAFIRGVIDDGERIYAHIYSGGEPLVTCLASTSLHFFGGWLRP